MNSQVTPVEVTPVNSQANYSQVRFFQTIKCNQATGSLVRIFGLDILRSMSHRYKIYYPKLVSPIARVHVEINCNRDYTMLSRP